MDKKGGHGLERFNLLCLQQLLGQLNVEEAGGGLVSESFEEIEILGPKGFATNTISQDNNSEEFAA